MSQKLFTFLHLLIFSMLSIVVEGQINLPYAENFENGDGGWVASSNSINTNWEYGSPMVAPTNTANSGVFCWDINLTSQYGNGAIATLTSPVFNAGPDYFKRLSFWHNTASEDEWDGFRLEVSYNGQPWQVLGSVNDPAATNWYTDTMLNSSNLPAWEGYLNGWIKSTYLIENIINQTVQFRFVFTSDPSVPDVGVSIDDFSFAALPAIDLSLQSIDPIPNAPIGMQTDSILVSIKNFSNSTVSGFVISANQNGTWVNTTTITDSIAVNQTRSFRIPPLTAVAGINQVCIKVVVAGDGDSLNNEKCISFTGISTVTIPYFDNFNMLPSSWNQSTSGNSFTNWEHGTPQYGSTSLAFSAPYCWDINLQTAYTNNAESYLYSPVIDLSGAQQPFVGFYMNYNTEGVWDGIRLEYSLNTGLNWQVLGTKNDPAGVNWYTHNIINSSQLPGWSGASSGYRYYMYRLSGIASSGLIQFRFVFTSDGSQISDGVSIDDFLVTSAAPFDASILQIKAPTGTYYSTSQPLIIQLANNGTQPLTSFPVTYQINQQTPVSIQWNGNLVPGDSVLFNLGNISFSNGLNNISVYINWNQDTLHFNDTARTVVNAILPLAIPYFNNFNSGLSGWSSSTINPGNVWTLGAPSYGTTNSSFSPPACWDINIATPYVSSNVANLYSPPFNIQGNAGIEIKFRMNLNTQPFYDGLTVYYSTDNLTWQVLGTLNDPQGKNWYNSQLVNGNTPAWTGNSGGWILASLKTYQLMNDDLLFLRFSFEVSPTVNLDGVSIDDFTLRPIYEHDASLVAIINPPLQLLANNAEFVSILLRNEGLLPITSLNLSYKVDNGTPVSQVWNGNLLSDSTTIVSFPPQLFTPGLHTITSYLTWALDSAAENDTARITIEAIQPIAIPYTENFDAGPSNWSVQTTGLNTTTWEEGQPMYGATSSAHSLPDCWDVNLYNPYNNLARTFLKTPVFDFSNLGAVSLNFWVNYNTEINTDGLYIEYTSDEINWIPLSSLNDPLATNGYNSSLFNGRAAWTGNSQGWTQVTINSFQVGGLPYCRFRFGFQSDFSLNGDGVSVDDFSLSGYSSLNAIENGDFQLYPNPVTHLLYLKNLSPGHKTMRILDATGREVLAGELEEEDASVHVKELSTGSYLLIIEYANGIKSFKRFIKSDE